VDRFRAYLKATSTWDDTQEKALQAELDSLVAHAIKAAEGAPPPALETLIEDVFAEPTHRLRRQLGEILDRES
jgi:2-oxoisovalerate dehydrogenase E1 component alpha subunit